MKGLNSQLRTLDADSRFGWAFPFVNFAGKGFRLNLGARPRTCWDFNTKLHDLQFFLNNLSFSLVPPSDSLERSKLEKADYIYRLLNPHCDRRFPESIYNEFSKLIFLGKDKSRFMSDDGFQNVLHHPKLTIEDGHFMIPFSEIPKEEQAQIEKTAEEHARNIVETQDLEKIALDYGIDVKPKWRRTGGPRTRRRESEFHLKNRIIRELIQECKYNVISSVDDQPWQDWAMHTFGATWKEAADI